MAGPDGAHLGLKHLLLEDWERLCPVIGPPEVSPTAPPSGESVIKSGVGFA